MEKARGEGYHGRLTVIDNLTRHRGQGGEFVGGSLRVLACQSAHERTLAHRREADEANTGYACSGHIETSTSATTSATGSQQFALELGQLGLKLTQMVRSRLVLLGFGHLVTKVRADPGYPYDKESPIVGL